MTTLKAALIDTLANPNALVTAADRIDAMYAAYQQLAAGAPWDNGKPEPLSADALDFLGRLRGATAAETKKPGAATLQADRGVALGQIETWVQGAVGTACGAFPHINPFRFAVELALRVRRPSAVNQERTVLCGAAGILSAYFKTDPKRATQFALDLVDHGSGQLRQYVIEPVGAVRNQAPPTRFGMAPVDWVMLASLRYHFEPLAELIGLFSATTADPLRQLTKPALLYSALSNMGYATVNDRTFGLSSFSAVTQLASAITRYGMHAGSEPTQGDANLQLAASDVAAGKLVFLWAYGDLTDETPVRSKATPYPNAANTPQREVDAITFPKLHWTLVRKLIVTPTEVKIRHYSWGNAREATFPKAEFLHVYQGYVVADPA